MFDKFNIEFVLSNKFLSERRRW